jgi:signal transduction histidine kinase/ligand-binding sensor domain-containing protein
MKRLTGYTYSCTILLLFTALLAATRSAVAVNPEVQISQYSHTAWRLQDGVLPTFPQARAQTIDGYFWIGTTSGLLRFDGVRFVPWKPKPKQNLPVAVVTSLLADPDGSLWIGTARGLSHMVGGNLINFPDTVGYVESILQDASGNVWFTRAKFSHDDNGGGLCEVQGLHTRCFGAKDGMPFRYAGALAQDATGFFWIGSDVGLVRWKPGSNAVSYSPPGLKAAQGQQGVEVLVPGVDGSMWVGMSLTGPGLGLQNLKEGKWQPITLPGLDSSKLSVSSTLLDSSGSLWIGTGEQGLYRVHGGKVDHFGIADGLSGDGVGELSQDKEGNIWVTTSEGMDRFREMPVTILSTHQGLSGNAVTSVFATRDGSLWIANGSAIDILKNGNLSSIGPSAGLPGKEVFSVFEDKEGRMWAGVDNKLVVYEKGVFRTVNMPDGTPFGLVDGITEDSEATIWVASQTRGFMLHSIRDYKPQQEKFPPNLPSVYSASPNRDGGMWLGLLNGDLASYKDGKLFVYPGPHQPVGANPLREISTTPDGAVFAAYNSGLAEWRNGALHALSLNNGLPCRSVISYLRDERQNLYLNMECGIVSISAEEMERWWNHPETNVKFKHYNSSDGARPAQLYTAPGAARTSDGKLWFASNVLQMMDPNHLAFNNLPPPVHIENVVDDGKIVSLQPDLILPPRLHRLQFDYTALSFGAPQKVRFRYRLEGHDTDWQDAGFSRQALYNDLPPAHYKFHVIAANNDGVWNETGDLLSFTIAPAFYQTLWFRALVVVIACVVLWLLYLLRLAAATEKVRTRMTERLAERERIARDLHDTLLQGFQLLTLVFQAAMTHMSSEDPNRKTMGQALGKADNVLLEARNTIRNLRAEEDTPDSLPEALKETANQLPQAVPVEFTLDCTGDIRLLNPAMREELFRIGQEALINSYQHSGASKVGVTINYSPARLEMAICDNGTGIAPDILSTGRKGHWGLSGMRERANSIGGELAIRTAPSTGTEIIVSVPGKLAYRTSGDRSRWQRFFKAMWVRA